MWSLCHFWLIAVEPFFNSATIKSTSTYWNLMPTKLLRLNCKNQRFLFNWWLIFHSFFFQTCPMKGRPEDSFLEQFSERFMDHVRQVCTFAKLIPGFKCLHHDDQVTLLKSCVFEVLLVRLAGLFDSQVSWFFYLMFNLFFFFFWRGLCFLFAKVCG